MLIHLEKNEQFKEIVNKEKLVLVDFYANWCGPCKLLSPILEQLAQEEQDLTIIKIDVDEFEEIAREFQVFQIPTLIVFKNGNISNRTLGYMPKSKIKELWK